MFSRATNHTSLLHLACPIQLRSPISPAGQHRPPKVRRGGPRLCRNFGAGMRSLLPVCLEHGLLFPSEDLSSLNPLFFVTKFGDIELEWPYHGEINKMRWLLGTRGS